MTEFTASNGIKITANDYGTFKTLLSKTVDNTVSLAGVHVDALREFFQHERDEELGRWRDRSYPDHAVYPSPRTPQVAGRGVQVLDERTGRLYDRWEAPTEFNQWDTSPRELAARAYFEAHPERKPWHAPEAGEHWALHIAHGLALSDDEQLFKYTRWRNGEWRFVPTDGGSVLLPTDPSITAGRLIWPEDAS